MNIHNMNLHEEIEIDNCNTVMKVPGGWNYKALVRSGDEGWSVATTFVPYNDEFDESSEIEGIPMFKGTTDEAEALSCITLHKRG